jgi:hypothetical protein
MSAFLKIGKNNRIQLDGEPVNLSEIDDVNSFLKSSLSYYTEIEEDVTLGDFVHLCFYINDFIKEYCLEEYEVVRAFVNTGKLRKYCTEVSISKSLKIESILTYDEEEFLYFFKKVKLVESFEVGKGTNSLMELPIKLDKNIEFSHGSCSIKTKVKFTFLEIVEAVFEELAGQLREEPLLSA